MPSSECLFVEVNHRYIICCLIITLSLYFYIISCQQLVLWNMEYAL